MMKCKASTLRSARMRSVRQPDLSDGTAVDSGFNVNSEAAGDSHVETIGGAAQRHEVEVTVE